MKVLKLVDQDKYLTLSIIYEAMDRAKMTIKTSMKNWEKYWKVIDKRWSNKLHRQMHAASNKNKKNPNIVIIIYSNAKYYKLIIFFTYDSIFFKFNVSIFKAILPPSQIKIGLTLYFLNSMF